MQNIKFENSNTQDENGNTIMHILCNQQYPDIENIKLAINTGVDLTVQNKDGYTCLHYVCEKSANIELIVLLLNNGASAKIRDNKGLSCLLAAYKNFLIEIYNSCLYGELYKKINYEVNEEIINLLLEKGADKRDLYTVELIKASKDGENIQLIADLLEKGADPNAAGLGIAIVSMLCMNPKVSIDVLNIVLKYRPDLKAQDQYGATCMHYIFGKTPRSGNEEFNPNIELISLLLEHGAELNTKASIEVTPLHMACRNESVNINTIKFLIEKGADPTMQSKHSYMTGFTNLPYTCLEAACLRYSGIGTRNRHIDVMNCLFKYNNDLTLLSDKALENIIATSNTKLVFMILAQGLKIEALDLYDEIEEIEEMGVVSNSLCNLIKHFKNNALKEEDFLILLKEEILSILPFNLTKNCLPKSDKDNLLYPVFIMKYLPVKFPRTVQGLFFNKICNKDTSTIVSLLSLIKDQEADEILDNILYKLAKNTHQI